MKTRFSIQILSLFFLKQVSFAQTKIPADTIGLYLEFPVLDMPHQFYATRTTGSFFTGYANPSMAQSLAMSNNLYSTAHYGINRGVRLKNEFFRKLLGSALVLGFDLISLYAPFGMGWLHEEYHRAVLTRREINSFNDMNTFPVWASYRFSQKNR